MEDLKQDIIQIIEKIDNISILEFIHHFIVDGLDCWK